jgi:tetratricopeptide (TPR) repeat protein
MLGHPEESVKLLGEALEINPDSPKANYQMGELLSDQHKYADARKYLEVALKLDPCNAPTIYGLAIVMRRLGDAAQSKVYFDRFKEVDRENKDPANAGKTCLATAQSAP